MRSVSHLLVGVCASMHARKRFSCNRNVTSILRKFNIMMWRINCKKYLWFRYGRPLCGRLTFNYVRSVNTKMNWSIGHLCLACRQIVMFVRSFNWNCNLQSQNATNLRFSADLDIWHLVLCFERRSLASTPTMSIQNKLKMSNCTHRPDEIASGDDQKYRRIYRVTKINCSLICHRVVSLPFYF